MAWNKIHFHRSSLKCIVTELICIHIKNLSKSFSLLPELIKKRILAFGHGISLKVIFKNSNNGFMCVCEKHITPIIFHGTPIQNYILSVRIFLEYVSRGVLLFLFDYHHNLKQLRYFRIQKFICIHLSKFIYLFVFFLHYNSLTANILNNIEIRQKSSCNFMNNLELGVVTRYR